AEPTAIEAPTSAPAEVALAGSRAATAAGPPRRMPSANTPGANTSLPLSGSARRLADRLEDWLGREALIGAVILLLVALLGAYAGSLATTPAGAAASGASSSPFVQTQTVSGYSLSLKVSPDTFGTNTFYVSVKDSAGQPLDGASVVITTNMLDMDMGTQSLQLHPLGSGSPGTYSGQADLTMAGHWAVLVKVTAPNSAQPIQTQFTFIATY
ncbi:MAG: FixH family protein, partial [Ktedonobacterales bacterium]